MTATAAAVGVDVGGTKLTACAITTDGAVVTHTRSASPVGDANGLLDEVARLVREVGHEPDLPFGVGVPGPVDLDGVIDLAPNLDVVDLDVAAGLEQRVGRRPVVTNDASAALLAEQAVGAAVGHTDVVMLTVGTGVGGAVLVAGELLIGAHGFAGELGHVLAVPDGPLCGCGATGCLEAVASGSAMAARAAAAVAAGEVSRLADVDPIDGHALDAAASAGDGLAVAIRREAAEHLGRAAASLVNVFDPSLVLLGGGAGVNAAAEFLPVMEDIIATRVTGRSRPIPRVALAALGDDAGMIGAGLLALRSTRS